jgi:hypothetical protein
VRRSSSRFQFQASALARRRRLLGLHLSLGRTNYLCVRGCFSFLILHSFIESSRCFGSLVKKQWAHLRSGVSLSYEVAVTHCWKNSSRVQGNVAHSNACKTPEHSALSYCWIATPPKYSCSQGARALNQYLPPAYQPGQGWQWELGQLSRWRRRR